MPSSRRMIDAFFLYARKGLSAWARAVNRRPRLVALTFLLITLAALIFSVRNMAISTDTSQMLSQDLSFQKLSVDLSKAFPHLDETLLVVVDGDSPELANEAASELTARFRAEPGLFLAVQDIADDPFFRQNGLLFMDQVELDALSDRLAMAQPFLGALWHDPSLVGLCNLLGMAIEAQHDGRAGQGLAMDAELKAITSIVNKQTNGQFGALSWQNLIQGATPNDQARRFILLEPKLDKESLAPADTAMSAVRRIAFDLGLTPDHGVTVRMTGSVALDQEELTSVEEGMGIANLAALALVIAFLVVGLKDARLVGSVLATLLAGLAASAALALLMVGRLNLISVAFAVLFIGIGVDFGIHYALRYREARLRGQDDRESLAWAAGTVGGPLSLCAIAASIGFFSFLPTDYRGLAELGEIAGVSMFVALFYNLTLLPALISLWPVQRIKVPKGAPASETARFWVPSKPGHAVTIAAILALASALFIPWARFDFDPLHLKDPKSESMSTLMDIGKDPRNGPYGITILADNLDEAEKLAARLKILPGVGEATSIGDYVPKDQQAKMESIDSLAIMLTPLFLSNHAPAPGDAERRLALQELMAKLNGDNPVEAELKSAMSRLPDTEQARSELERRLVGKAPKLLEDLKTSLQASPFELKDLPEAIRYNQIAPDGRVKVEVYPSGNVADPAQLAQFVETVRQIAPKATGGPVTIYEASRTVLKAFRDATLITLVGLTFLLGVTLRNLRDVLLVFAPLTLAALMLIPITVLGNLPLNFANVIVLPLLFGLGIANGIQFVVREKLEGDARRVLATSTPRAVIFSAVTTMVSFGSLAASSHPGTSAMGLLLAIALTLTLACTLLILPALMMVWSPRSGDAAK